MRAVLGRCLSAQGMESLLVVVNGFGVGGEAVAGAVFGYFAIFPPATQVARAVLLGTVIFVVFMHSYISECV